MGLANEVWRNDCVRIATRTNASSFGMTVQAEAVIRTRVKHPLITEQAERSPVVAECSIVPLSRTLTLDRCRIKER